MKVTDYFVTLDYRDSEVDDYKARYGEPDYDDGYTYRWYFDSEDELDAAIGNPVKLHLDDFVLYMSTSDFTDSLLDSDDYKHSLPNSLGIQKNRRVYLLLSKKDQLPLDLVLSRVSPNRKKSIVRGADILWRGNKVSRSLKTMNVEGRTMYQKTITKDTWIPGTDIVLEKNDRIFYGEASKMTPAKFKQFHEFLEKKGWTLLEHWSSTAFWGRGIYLLIADKTTGEIKLKKSSSDTGKGLRLTGNEKDLWTGDYTEVIDSYDIKINPNIKK